MMPQVSLFHASCLPDPSISNHFRHPARRFHTLPLSAIGSFQASPFSRRLADADSRIEFVILWTGRSPPIAPHLASRQRSYLRLRAGECVPGEDSHLSVRKRSQAHECGTLVPRFPFAEASLKGAGASCPRIIECGAGRPTSFSLSPATAYRTKKDPRGPPRRPG